MKKLLRNFLIHLSAIWITSFLIPGFTLTGGPKTLVLGSLGLMFVNMMIIPLLRIMFLPLNLLTLGLFTWVINVVGLYVLTTIIPQIKLMPFYFQGMNLGAFSLPPGQLNVLQTAVVASLLIGFISHFFQWLSK